jgi:hypothetical protein
MNLQLGTNILSSYRRLVGIVMLVSIAVCQSSFADAKYPDAKFRDKDNDNATLVVFFAGLGGKGSWDRFTELMDSDSDFDGIDYLDYFSPQTLDIEENARRAQTLLAKHQTGYEDIVFVGHSIGGIMIKQTLLMETSASSDARILPGMIITFGTPLDTDKFTVSMFQRLGARIFWTSVSRLKREVFNLDRLKEINASWRTAVTNIPLSKIRNINIFGVDDEIAPVENEGSTLGTVFINGDHLGIITPGTTKDCSWVVFKTVLLDRVVDPRSIDCVLPVSASSAQAAG